MPTLVYVAVYTPEPTALTRLLAPVAAVRYVRQDFVEKGSHLVEVTGLEADLVLPLADANAAGLVIMAVRYSKPYVEERCQHSAAERLGPDFFHLPADCWCLVDNLADHNVYMVKQPYCRLYRRDGATEFELTASKTTALERLEHRQVAHQRALDGAVGDLY